MLLPFDFGEWGWLLGFALVSLLLVGFAVLIDALYEGYRERNRKFRQSISGSPAALPKAQAESDRENRRAA